MQITGMAENSTQQDGNTAAGSQNQAADPAVVSAEQAAVQPSEVAKPEVKPEAAPEAELPQEAEKKPVDSEKKEEKAAEEEAKPKAEVSEETKKKAESAAAKADVKKNKSKEQMEHRKKILEAEKIYQEGIASIRDLIAPSSFEVAYDHIKVDGMYSQTFFVYTYPRYIDTNWLSPVVNFDVTMDISQFIYPISSEAIMKTLKTKVAQLQSSIRMSAEKGNVRDPALETALEDAETLRTELQRGQEKFFQFGLYFTLYSEDEEELRRASKELQSLLAGKLVLSKRADLQMERGFNSTIPICLDEIDVDRNMNTSPLSTTFPFISAELTSNDGILYGLNRHNEGLIIFDRFSLENANSVVFAKSGAGKSYAVKLEILRSLMFGTDVIVIDPENEYKPLCETVGGTYLNVSLNSDRRINPFDLPTPLEGDDLKPGDLLRSSVINLTGLMKLMLGEMTPQEEGILDKALIDTYATKGITMEVSNPSQYEVPTMKDFYSVLSSMDGAGDMSQRLSKYVTGTYAGVFNQETNVQLDTGLMVFSVRDLEDELRPVAMYIILNYIWNRVRSQLRKRVLVIDEAWSLMQHDDSARFLFGLVKRARKYYLGVTTITQDVEDFVNSHFGKPIITNSSMQLLLKQSPMAMESLSKVFNLTEGERYLLLNSGVGQGLFFAGLKHVAIQIIASYGEDKIVTTNPEELLTKGAVEAEYEEASGDGDEDFEAQEPVGVPEQEAEPVAVAPVEAPAEPVEAAIEKVVPSEQKEDQDLEAGFTENVASVLDAPAVESVVEADPTVELVPEPVAAEPAMPESSSMPVMPEPEPVQPEEAAPVEPQPGPVQDVPVDFGE
jgi:conjugal transfer ATP-binding protein TraC